jgi:tetratricopeptide (TPR) repeat protein
VITRSFRTLLILALVAITSGTSLAKKPETWTEVRSPNFLVVTNASEKQGRHVAYQFEMIRLVFRQFFHVQGSTTDPPITIIAASDEEALKPLMPEYWADKGSSLPAGIYLGSAEKNYIALRLDVSMNKETSAPFEPVYHEYVHYLTRRGMSQLPLWMVEGLAEFYGNTRIEGDRVILGAPSSVNRLVLAESQPLPIGTLFAVNASSPYYHEQNKTSIFYAESWALTHYLITRDWREGTHRVSDFVALLEKNVAPEEAARRTIGDFDALQQELGEYIERFAITTGRQDAPPGINAKDFTARTMSDAESLAVRADFMAHDRHYREAQTMLEEALTADPNLAAAHESMGYLMSEQGKMDEATKWFSEAVALNSQSCLANYFYAVSLFKRVTEDKAAAQAEASLRAAIKISPEFTPAYTALGWLLATRHNKLDEAYRLELTAVTLEPGDVQIRFAMVRVMESMDRFDDAVRVATIAVSMAKTMQEQRQALGVLSTAREYQAEQERAKKQEEDFKARATAGGAAAGMASPSEAANPSREAVSTPDLDSAKPPVLRHYDDAPEGGSAISSPSAPSRAHPPRPELLPSRRVVEGTVKDVRCAAGLTLEITLSSDGRLMQFFSDNYLKISYSALNFTPAGILNPCADIKGWYARVTYHPAKDHANQGEILAMGFAKD